MADDAVRLHHCAVPPGGPTSDETPAWQRAARAILESAGVLPPPMREMVVDRAMAVGSAEEMLRVLRGEPPLNLVNPEHKAA